MSAISRRDAQRASAAFLAIAFRLAGEKAAARAALSSPELTQCDDRRIFSGMRVVQRFAARFFSDDSLDDAPSDGHKVMTCA